MNDPSVHEYFSLSEQALPLTVTTYTRAAHECLFPAHWHRQIELLTVTAGSMRVVCADTVQTVTAGELLFVNPYESHLGHAGEQGVTYTCLIVEPSLWYDALAEGSAAALPRIRNRLADETIRSLAEAVSTEYRGHEVGRELFIRAHLLLIFGRAARHHGTDTPAVEAEARIGEVMRYISGHYTESLSTRQLADTFGFSLSYFCRYFKEATGATVLQYINAVRLSHACRLLQQTTLPIGDISRRVGFTGVNYFVRQFHNQMGCSPLQFRKQSHS